MSARQDKLTYLFEEEKLSLRITNRLIADLCEAFGAVNLVQLSTFSQTGAFSLNQLLDAGCVLLERAGIPEKEAQRRVDEASPETLSSFLEVIGKIFEKLFPATELKQEKQDVEEIQEVKESEKK